MGYYIWDGTLCYCYSIGACDLKGVLTVYGLFGESCSSLFIQIANYSLVLYTGQICLFCFRIL